MVRPTNRKLKALEKEERKSSKEYRKMGFKKLANDEADHARFLKKKQKKR